MSHFNVVVLLPENTPMNKVEGLIAKLMAPYDEGLQVSEYLTPCWCVGKKAQEEVASAVNAEFPIERIREKFWTLPEEDRTEGRWNELVKPRVERWTALLAEHPMKDKPDSQCQRCGGIGQRLSTYNPSSKYDFWNVGGRWDGWIHGPEREEQCQDGKGGFNFGEEHHRLDNNCRPVQQIPIDDLYYVPFAVVTPDGKWHEQGTMGWWAIVAAPMDEKSWHNTVKSIYAQHPDHLAVTVDCHI